MTTDDVARFASFTDAALAAHLERLFELAAAGHGDSDLGRYGNRVDAELRRRAAAGGMMPCGHAFGAPCRGYHGDNGSMVAKPTTTDTSDHHFATFRGSRLNAHGNPRYEERGSP